MRGLRVCYVCTALISIGAILMLPTTGFSQDPTLSGPITDLTSAVIPGVTVTAIHVESGNKFVAVTDERGNFRLAVRVGNYKITAELPGFTMVNRTIQILVGQTVVVNIEMMPSTVAEVVNGTGEARPVETTTTNAGANTDPRRIKD